MDIREQLQKALGSDYEFHQELTGGGMSRVFVATDRKLGRKVVIKVMAPELAAAINAERFSREIRVAASLQQANIVPLLTAGETDGVPWFTMPYVEGHSLRERLVARRLTVAEATSVLRDVGRALSYAHAHGVVHRDIKPENILLSHGAAEVTDFGIAKAISASRATTSSGPKAVEGTKLTAVGTSVGTPAYMSPEQTAGDPSVDLRSDIYSLGVVGYEMLEGRLPFEGPPQAIAMGHLSQSPPPITRSDAPPALRRVVMRCLEKDPANRFQSGDELLAALETISTPAGIASVILPPRRIAAVLVGVAALAIAGWTTTSGMRGRRWVRVTAVPQISDLVDRGEPDSAWSIARRALEIAPTDSAMNALLPSFTRPTTITSEPSGARVYRSAMDDTTAWILLGTTPIDSMRLPTRNGRVRVELEGYRTTYGILGAGARQFTLKRSTDPDSGLLRVAGGNEVRAFLVGADRMPALKLGDFDIQANEVSNIDFKKFIDAGGYARRDLWPAQFSADGRALSFEQAVARFVDRTGRPGPSTWEGGSYPSGQGDLPVGGLSWYEAAAYAKFAGLSLPTAYHWARAAAINQARWMVPASNYDGKGPVRGGSIAGISFYGAYDMAGNVREWCENTAGADRRLILGGGWTDAPYQFTDAYAIPAMNREAINGIRLARYSDPDSVIALAGKPVIRAFSDYPKEKQVSDNLFQLYRRVFNYDRTPLNARLDSRDTTQADWIVERASFDAAYGAERVQAYILLPRQGKPPYQTMVVWPGSGALNAAAGGEARYPTANFVVGSGRAYVLPIIKGTWGRSDGTTSDLPDSTVRWRDHVVMWVKDVRRTLDYLSTRPDIDTNSFAFFGHSWGSASAPLVLATDSRFKAGVLYVPGLTMERGQPEVDPFYYLPHVTVPVLMLSGRYDFFYPVETAQRPFFNALGTPTDKKKWTVYEGGHDVPRTALIAETLHWLDQYLGPVRR